MKNYDIFYIQDGVRISAGYSFNSLSTIIEQAERLAEFSTVKREIEVIDNYTGAIVRNYKTKVQ